MVSNGDVCAEGPSLPKMDFMALSNLAEQFVLQYYTVMNKCPELLHRFYGEDSTLIYESPPICGVSNGPFRRFLRSFTLLEKNPQDFYVLSDILRFQDRVYIHEGGEARSTPGRLYFCYLFLDSAPAEAKERIKAASEKSATKVSNGAAQEQKRQVHEKRSEAPPAADQVSEPRRVETPIPPCTQTPKPPAEVPPQKVVEKQSAAPVVQSQQVPPPPPPPLPQQQSLPAGEARQQPVTQQPVSTAPLSWAQRASGNIGSVPTSSVVTHRPQPQVAKPAPAEHPAASTLPGSAPKVGIPKQYVKLMLSSLTLLFYRMRTGGRPHQADIRRDSNGDRSDVSLRQIRC
ncbi:unnamed protein product [Hydatigera taeniaeformis]|uniref:NTF2 domain-containing protein n=1 Tax=Hydatigena taeniaeformis TaxID=6205 RepID=A0A0R3X412_HYDTA|nr:unnamed protein product [Hydatigera taeniaeformis]